MFDPAVLMYFLPFNPKHVKLCVNIGSRNGSVPNIATVRIYIIILSSLIAIICNNQLTKRYFNYEYEHSSKQVHHHLSLFLSTTSRKSPSQREKDREVGKREVGWGGDGYRVEGAGRGRGGGEGLEG